MEGNQVKVCGIKNSFMFEEVLKSRKCITMTKSTLLPTIEGMLIP